MFQVQNIISSIPAAYIFLFAFLKQINVDFTERVLLFRLVVHTAECLEKKKTFIQRRLHAFVLTPSLPATNIVRA